MTFKQADLINKKYKELQSLYSELEEEHLILKQINETQSDTIISKSKQIQVLKDSINIQSHKSYPDTVSGKFKELTDSLWKWALGPTLIYTQWPDSNVVYLMDLSEYYLATDDFGIIMMKMSSKEYVKYLTFKQVYGLPEQAFFQFRTNMNIKRLKTKDISEKKVWKYKGQWK